MGQTLETLRTIRDDLLTSWYFRIWFLMWIVCAITVFVCLGFVGHRADVERKEPSYRIWFEKANVIHYPDFQIRAQALENTLHTFSCATEKNTPVQVTNCPVRGGDNRWCRIVHAGAFTNANGRIVCNIVTVPGDTVEHLLAWEAVNASTDFTPLPDTNIWFAPDDHIWVTLSKEVESRDGHWATVFRPTLLYHSTRSVPGNYSVSTLFSSLKVIHYDIADWYNGWQVLGIVGGYTFSLLILHKMVMILVGLFISNNSTFLGGNLGKGAPYATLTNQNL